MRAALSAADAGAQVAMITGGGPTGSTYYPLSPAWGVMYAEGEKDCEAFFSEILSSSLGCLNPKLARQLVEDSAAGIMTCKAGDYISFLLNQSG